MKVLAAILLGLFAAMTAPAMAQTSPVPVTPRACDTTTVSTGGTAVSAITGPVNGYIIVNPTSAANQGIETAEDLALNMVTSATTTENGTTIELVPGQSYTWTQQSPLTNPVSVNAATSGHEFACERW
jgi:hypothetical protein